MELCRPPFAPTWYVVHYPKSGSFCDSLLGMAKDIAYPSQIYPYKQETMDSEHINSQIIPVSCANNKPSTVKVQSFLKEVGYG